MLEPVEIRKIIRESFAIILAAAVLGFSINLFHPKGYTLAGRESAKYRRIVPVGIDEAKIKFDGNAAVFIDARDAGEFTAARITGALHIPAQPESVSLKAIQSHFTLLRQPKEAVVYCGGSSCGDSETLARRLIDLGYPRTVYVIAGSFTEWEKKEYPVTRGTE